MPLLSALFPVVVALAVPALSVSPKCQPVEPPDNGLVLDVACGTAAGAKCEIACLPGYDANGPLILECLENGYWSNNGTTCYEHDGCRNRPCDPYVSECVDSPPPDVGHTCKCLESKGYIGQGGSNGFSCRRAAEIKAEDDNIIVRIGEHNKFELQKGESVLDISNLFVSVSSLSDQITTVRSTVQSINEEGGKLALLSDDITYAEEKAASDLANVVQGVIKENQDRIAVTESDAVMMKRQVRELFDGQQNATRDREDLQTMVDGSTDKLNEIGAQIEADLNEAFSTALQQLTSGTLENGEDISTEAVLLSLSLMETSKANKLDLLNKANISLVNTKADKEYVDDNFGRLPVSTTSECTTMKMGFMRFNQEENQVQICNSAGIYKNIAPAEFGEAPSSSAVDCEEIREKRVGASSGVYFVGKPSGVPVYCAFAGASVDNMGGDGSSSQRAGHSCRVIKEFFGKNTNGQYYIRGVDGPVLGYCDMSRDGGGWTLLVSSKKNTWTLNSILSTGSGNLEDNFSMLSSANLMKDSHAIGGTTVEYRLEGHQLGRWGGIFSMPREYSFTSTSTAQTDIKLIQRFDDWDFHDDGIEARVPYLATDSRAFALLTTSRRHSDRFWGTIAGQNDDWVVAPWINHGAPYPDGIWYWAREGPLSPGQQVYDKIGTQDHPADSCAQVRSTVPFALPNHQAVHIKNKGLKLCSFKDGGAVEVSGDGTASDNPALSCRVLLDHMGYKHEHDQHKTYIQGDGKVVTTICDYETHGGGWTLLVTSNGYWGDLPSDVIMEHNEQSATVDGKFTILKHADSIKNNNAFKAHGTFQYRLDAGAFGRWGGIWEVPQDYTFVQKGTGQSVNPPIIKFDNWGSGHPKMPWVVDPPYCTHLATSGWSCYYYEGHVVSQWENPAPWIISADCQDGDICGEKVRNTWYWLREGPLLL